MFGPPRREDAKEEAPWRSNLSQKKLALLRELSCEGDFRQLGGWRADSECMDRQDAKTPRKEPSAEVDAWAHAVVDAAFEVHATLGPGYDEMVYENALCIELEMRGIPFTRQLVTLVEYKGHVVGEGRLDLLVGEQLIVELKAIAGLAPVHTAQVLAYLEGDAP